MKEKMSLIIVNFFTALRAAGIIALIPVFINMGGVAAAVLATTCYLTDFIDGFLARKLHASTFFGSVFDGSADKAFNLVNFCILLSITPLAIIPIIIEVGIIAVQSKKYQERMNVKSNTTGKVKMWIAAITVILSYFLVDVASLNFISTELINKISKINPSLLFGATLTPLIISEIATFIGYINEFVKGIKEPINEKTNTTLKEDTVKTELEEREKEIIKEKEKLISEKEKLYTMKELLFSPAVYDEYKDQDGLKLVLDKVIKNKSK